MKKVYYYGVISQQALFDTAVAVCDVMGHGSGYAVELLMETAAAETLCGTYRDTTDYSAGTSVMQIDEGTFDWLQGKYANTAVAKCLKEQMDIDISRVSYRELEHNPLLGMIWARMRYMAVKQPIPKTLEERAAYWKKWYNSVEGKGTPEEYLDRVKRCNIASFFG